MTAEYARKGRQQSALPGRPAPFFLTKGQGDHAVLFDQLITVLLSGEETNGQFGVFTLDAPKGETIPTHSHDHDHEIFYVIEGEIRVWIQTDQDEILDELLTVGDFGYVPAGHLHAFRIESDLAKVFGVSTGGFERFFETAGTVTDSNAVPPEPFIPDREQLSAAAERFANRFHFDVRLDR